MLIIIAELVELIQETAAELTELETVLDDFVEVESRLISAIPSKRVNIRYCKSLRSW